MTSEKDWVPDEYPIDNYLLIEAEIYNNGSYVHDINQMSANYKYSVSYYNKQPNDSKNDLSEKRRLYYHSCLKYERMLRGIVAEAKIRKK